MNAIVIGNDEDILRQARIETADALAAVTENDNVSIMAAEVATRIFRALGIEAISSNSSRLPRAASPSSSWNFTAPAARRAAGVSWTSNCRPRPCS